MSKTQLIQVVNQELYVLGKLISRHPEMPWLFSITDVYKACEVPLKKEAVKYGKDPEVTYASKRPVNWLFKNSKDETLDAVAGRLRKRLKKYGMDCGFQKSNATATLVALETLTNKQLCVFSTKGGSAKAKIHGTYVAQDFIIDYIDYLQLPQLASEYHKLVPTSSKDIVRTIKQHTKSRAELEFSKYLHAAAKIHKCELITQKTELDKYRVDFIFYSKRRQSAWLIEFDEDHHKYQTEEDSVRWSEIRERYSKFTKKPNNGFYFVRVSEGQHEEFLINFLTYLNTGNYNKLNFIHVN